MHNSNPALVCGHADQLACTLVNPPATLGRLQLELSDFVSSSFWRLWYRMEKGKPTRSFSDRVLFDTPP